MGGKKDLPYRPLSSCLFFHRLQSSFYSFFKFVFFMVVVGICFFIGRKKALIVFHNVSPRFFCPLEGNRAFFRKIHMEIRYKNLDLGAGEGGSTYTPPLRSRLLYRIFHMHLLKKCRVAFQWPVFVGCCKIFIATLEHRPLSGLFWRLYVVWAGPPTKEIIRSWKEK